MPPHLSTSAADPARPSLPRRFDILACFFAEGLTLAYVAVGFLALDGFFAFARFRAIGLNVQGHFGVAEYIRQAAFVAEYLLAVLVLYGATRVGRVRGAILLFLLALLTVADLAAHEIYGRPADIGNISALDASAAMLGAALREYGHVIAMAVGKTALLFGPLIAKTWLWRGRRWPLAGVLLLVCALAGMYGFILVKRGPPALIGFPKGFSYGLGSLYIGVNDLIERPDYVPSRPAGPPYGHVRNVIVVVDESVEYDYFARLFRDRPGRYADFGRAYSGANCSAASNYILRKAFWRRGRGAANHVAIAQTDSLFALAKRAGYTTTYIDNQQVLADPTTRNYIDDRELAKIDHAIENTGALYMRDAAAVAQIARTAATGRNFIFINKIGAHFPYRDQIAPSRASGGKVADYSAAIKDNSVDFLLALQDGLPADTIVFYTSDHGQSLTTRATHCNTGDETTEQEYRVPLLALSTNAAIQESLERAARIQRDRLTHLEFSESVRNVLGYRLDGVKSVFAPQAVASPYCGLYGSPKVFLGMLPECRELPVGFDDLLSQ
jgi:hypothetical protein